MRGADLSRRGIIYGLVDPRRPRTIRYVGQTADEPTNRLRAHMAPPFHDSSKRAQWCRELAEQGVYPDMVLLERVPDARALTDRERSWIAALIKKRQADLNGPLPKHWSARVARGLVAPAVSA